MSGRIIGIDFGTATSTMAAVIDGESQVIPNAEGQMSTPSVVAYDPETGQFRVGAEALTGDGIVVPSIKRFLGERRGTPSLEFALSLGLHSVGYTDDDRVQIVLGEEAFWPEELAALIFRKLKLDAESFLGETVEDVVLSIPSSFFLPQCVALRYAAEIAGLRVRRLLTEATAAALASERRREGDRTYMFFHHGAGSMDISAITAGDDVVEVVATDGDLLHGGDRLTRQVRDWICDRVHREHGFRLKDEFPSPWALWMFAERVKCRLWQRDTTEVVWAESLKDQDDMPPLTLSRTDFDDLVSETVEKIGDMFKGSLGDDFQRVEEVRYLGSQTRMPAIRQAVREAFPKLDHVGTVSPQMIAHGTAVQAGIINGDLDNCILLDLTSHAIGVRVNQFSIPDWIVDKNCTIPTRKSATVKIRDTEPKVDIEVVQGETAHPFIATTISQFCLPEPIPVNGEDPRQLAVGVSIDPDMTIHLDVSHPASDRSWKVRPRIAGMPWSRCKAAAARCRQLDEKQSHD